MPTYEYSCDSCEVTFEELLLQREEVERYKDGHPCPGCGQMAKRSPVVPISFTFKAPGGQTQGSGVHGQSGVHDLDYPALDKAVGRSAAKKWEQYNARKAERDKVRREAGTNNVSVTPEGRAVPADPAVMGLREKALSTFKKVKKSSEG